MGDWLAASIDPTRPHEIATLVSWHARLMMLAWGGLLPVGVLVARYFKIWPGQDWPRKLDDQRWWHSHLALQWSGSALAVLGLGLVIWAAGEAKGATDLHRGFGWAAMGLLALQVLGGLMRGVKGGPTQPAPDGSWRGDHYDMSRRRVLFEYIHKFSGYAALACAVLAILLGLWQVNAARGLWILIGLWWLALLVSAFYLQRRGRNIDTYQAIWGPDMSHPGNRMKPIGFGIRRRER